MKADAYILSTLVAALCGCYDFSFGSDDHTVTDLQILAIRAEPPFLLPGEPLWADVLYADPKGGGRTVQCAWKVSDCDQQQNNTSSPSAVVLPSTDKGTRMDLPPLHLRLSDKSSAPLMAIEVFLCGGELRDPARIASASDAELFQTLCQNGPLVSGEKNLYPSGDNSGNPLDTILNDDDDILSPPQNPRVDRLLINGIEMTAVEDGGKTIALCDERIPCDEPLSLSAYLDPSSMDKISLPRALSDAGILLDGGVSDSDFAKLHRIDWWVTGGTLSLFTSYASTSTFEAVTVEKAAGPFQTSWRLPDSASPSEYMLYVVTRNMRNGTGWKTYRFRTGGK